MKKIIGLSLALILSVFIMSACGPEDVKKPLDAVESAMPSMPGKNDSTAIDSPEDLNDKNSTTENKTPDTQNGNETGKTKTMK